MPSRYEIAFDDVVCLFVHRLAHGPGVHLTVGLKLRSVLVAARNAKFFHSQREPWLFVSLQQT